MLGAAAVNDDPVILTMVDVVVVIELGSTKSKSLVPVNVASRTLMLEFVVFASIEDRYPSVGNRWRCERHC